MKKVLIVEDEAPLRMALSDKLKNDGFEVFEAEDGAVGLELVASEKPDLILLDLMMPGVDGLSVIKRLKESEETKEIPIMVLTNSSGTDTIMDVVTHGVNDFIVKSDWSISDILTKVREKLK